MNGLGKILIGCASDCFEQANTVSSILEALGLQVELVVLSDHQQFGDFFNGRYDCEDHVLLLCKVEPDGLKFPLINEDSSGNWEWDEHYLSVQDVHRMRVGEIPGTILVLGSGSAKPDYAQVFVNSGFRYYIGHVGRNPLDSMILYAGAFYAALSGLAAAADQAACTIEQAHHQACGVQDLPEGTRGYRMYRLNPAG